MSTCLIGSAPPNGAGWGVGPKTINISLLRSENRCRILRNNFMRSISANIFSYSLLRPGCALLLTLAVSSVVAAQTQAPDSAPRVWEAPLSIPTYELGPPNPYPALLD